jgi:Ca2+-binding RTX toxin-like protein
MATINLLGAPINDDTLGNITLPPLTIHPSVGTIPATTPFPLALYQPPVGFTGLNLLNYFNTITTAAGSGGNLGAFFDLTDNNDNQTISAWSGFGPNSPGGVRALNGNDVITGSSDNDVINGNQGDDFLQGLNGYDFLRGGQGIDNIFGNNDNDIVNGNFGNDFVDGGNDQDMVRGGKGDDNLFGNNGDDILIGDLGKDILTGGAGADGFFLRSDVSGSDSNLAANEFAADQITDFTFGTDYILSNGISRNQVTFSNVFVGGVAGTSDTAILFGGQVLGVVIDTTNADVFNSFYNLGSSPSLLAIG